MGCYVHADSCGNGGVLLRVPSNYMPSPMSVRGDSQWYQWILPTFLHNRQSFLLSPGPNHSKPTFKLERPALTHQQSCRTRSFDRYQESGSSHTYLFCSHTWTKFLGPFSLYLPDWGEIKTQVLAHQTIVLTTCSPTY